MILSTVTGAGLETLWSTPTNYTHAPRAGPRILLLACAPTTPLGFWWQVTGPSPGTTSPF